MLTKKIEEALNNQINAELYSSYLYLSMSSFFESIDLPGFAGWMRVQADEENFHGMKMFDFVLERGGRMILQSIEAPHGEWKSAEDVFEATLAHEQKVTGLINDLVYLARDERDNATEIFLQWFVTEQVEEEDNVNKILGPLKLVKDSPQGLFMLDKELGQRVFTPPAAE
ncbi:MAG: ferritin [Planctomycetes bacterium]|nr:ferritin [Planctomycetota bacterium]